MFNVGRSALMLLLFLASPLYAGENPLKIELVSEVTSIQPGTPFHAALHLQHPPGYHTYWKFTGIVGIPTGIVWRLPSGWKADAIDWPAPERVFMFDIKAQGFHGEVFLPMLITPPKDLTIGQKVKLEGKASWMCCGRDCNPGFKELTLELPVTAEAPQADAHWSQQISHSLANVAKPSADWACSAKKQGKQMELIIQPLTEKAKEQFKSIKDITFFTEDGLIDPNEPSSLTKTERDFTLLQTLSEYAPKPFPKELQGILQTPQGWLPEGAPKSIRISVPLLPE